jgi:A/G-specific adenine glycosylase
MLSDKLLKNFSPSIIKWYHINRRELPWRDTNDAYLIWLSEIILQQTRVAQGLNYFLRFKERFPTVVSLAEADEQEILKLWQGLGYYSRARNLHKTAQIIAEKYDGIFPTDYNDILSLKGVGEYTAAAIASFAYNQPYAVVDGNVFRVLARIFGIDLAINSTEGKKQFSQLANQLLDKKNPSFHNQAIMEFGALQCTPQQPDCNNCIFTKKCAAFLSNSVSLLPVKEKKIKQRERHFNYFFIKNKNFTYLQKRTQKDIWLNLYEFPLWESDRNLSIEDIILQQNEIPALKDIQIEISSSLFKTKHILSHQIIYANFYTLKIEEENKYLKKCEKTSIGNLTEYPVSKLIDLFLDFYSKSQPEL